MSHKILVIDDEPEIREMLEALLTKFGYEVSTAESGLQAIEKVRSEPFSLVLCDVMMPGWDGITTLLEIKKINSSLPVIMMSGFGTHDRVIQAITHGAVDFIAKPISMIQISQIIKKSLIPEEASPVTHLLRESYLGLLKMIAQSMELKSPYFRDHSNRVAQYATKIAQALKLSESGVEVVYYAAVLHDIGKISVHDAILSKPAKLNKQEWSEMKMHPSSGRMIMEPLKFFRAEEPLILHHHEWYDGSGYPEGLRKESIPLGARIISIADAYDAMTSSRPYRKAMDAKTAQKIISENRGQQFDPKLTEIFLGIGTLLPAPGSMG